MRIACFLVVVVTFFQTSVLLADPPEDAELLDGLAAMVGGRAASESDSTAVLLSDVEFQAKLMMLYKSQGDAPLNDEVRIEARRIVVIVTILADQARQLQETVDPADVASLRKVFMQRAGGKETLNGILASYGMTGKQLDNWLENTILASKQISYVESQVELPSDEEISAKLTTDPDSQSNQGDADLYDELRRQIVADRLIKTVKTWLFAVLASANVRIVQ